MTGEAIAMTDGHGYTTQVKVEQKRMVRVFYAIGPVAVAQSLKRLLVVLGMCIGGFSVMACTQPPSPTTSPRPLPSERTPPSPASLSPGTRVAGGAPPSTQSDVPQSATSRLKQDYTQTAIPLSITLAPVTAAETAQLTQTNAAQKGQALQVGFGRAIPAADRADVLPRLAWTQFSDGALVSAFTVTSPQARSLRLALIAPTLAEGVEVRFFRPGVRPGVLEQSFGPFAQELLPRQPGAADSSWEPEDSEQFWSPVIPGDTIGVEIYLPSAEALQTSAVRLLQVSHMH